MTKHLLAQRFQQQHRAGGLLLPNAWDAASARIFEEAGFMSVGTTSAGVAYVHGIQDGERITRDAMLRVLATIVDAVSCPVNGDSEAGYGRHRDDIVATVEAVLDIGVAGSNLEDNTHDSSLFALDEQCSRISAAREVAERRGVPLVINVEPIRIY